MVLTYGVLRLSGTDSCLEAACSTSWSRMYSARDSPPVSIRPSRDSSHSLVSFGSLSTAPKVSTNDRPCWRGGVRRIGEGPRGCAHLSFILAQRGGLLP